LLGFGESILGAIYWRYACEMRGGLAIAAVEQGKVVGSPTGPVASLLLASWQMNALSLVASQLPARTAPFCHQIY